MHRAHGGRRSVAECACEAKDRTMKALTPLGTFIDVPECAESDTSSFRPEDLQEAVQFYRREGYVVIRGLLSPELCDAVRNGYRAEVLPSKTPILRQKNMRYERNRFDKDGFLVNPIFNVQDLESRRFGRFKNATLDVLTHPGVAALTAAVLGTPRTKVIQSMFFEAPAGTWAHQDSYYQDSGAGIGRCTAGWFALEDIDAGAGRFYVCPRSHKLMPLLRNAGELDFATGHHRYQHAVLEAIKRYDLPWHAPCLRKGDAIFWSSLTVHGSLGAERRGVSRTSLTAHYLPETDGMLQFHTRIRPQKLLPHNGMAVARLHDQDEWRNRAVRRVAASAPGTYAVVRKTAMRALFLAGKMRRAPAPVPVLPPDAVA
ncbi:phytanoyl-CoA dioxygenase family protein [Roseomonas sp. E05]|uniref:phytanoyl-CoA dioxygenase family protein n=1 Tax=Roseomonas sp. E05 TaxID=3046310 RepID=UPI0024B9B0C8|nr:phytanoyl-CoA dioxygenase family protein [Roseomonas sp. E05]MDJ0388423.1 phytanoyl-CoA dioxygenase family protein [Roseomonas sp. E05]